MSPPLRVALLTSARTWRGSGVSLGKIAAGLAERGHEVCAFVGETAVAEGFRGVGVPVAVTPTRDTGLREIAALRRRLRPFDGDAIIVDKLRDLRLAGWGGIGLRLAILYRYNISPFGTAPRLTDRLVLRTRTRLCVFQSEQVRRMAVARTPTLARLPSRVVYNGYDVDRWRPDPGAGAEFRARHGLPPDGLVVVTVSALERAKGQDVALQALEEVQRGGTPITYVLVGEGKHAAQIRARALHSPVATVFTGFLHGADIIGALNAADLYLHPAREEIFPNAVAEAMACGRAVVATEIGGMSELLGPDGGAGLLVPPDRPDVMADAIRRCIADAELRARLGVAGRRRIETRFPVPSMVDGYERALFAALDPVAR